MKPMFREDKVTQAAALFLKLRDNAMSHLKLMKLLYLAERETFLRFGRPISFDSYVSMNKGPVLSQTYNLMVEESETDGPWAKTISIPENYEVSLKEDPGVSKLSEAEEQVIQEIYDEHGKKSRWELCEYTHSFEEWQDPKGSSLKIEYRELLKAGKKTDAEIEAILEDIENLATMEILLEQ